MAEYDSSDNDTNELRCETEESKLKDEVRLVLRHSSYIYNLQVEAACQQLQKICSRLRAKEIQTKDLEGSPNMVSVCDSKKN